MFKKFTEKKTTLNCKKYLILYTYVKMTKKMLYLANNH